MIQVSSKVTFDASALKNAISAALPAAAQAFARAWPAEITRQNLVDTGALRDGLTFTANSESIRLSFPIYGAYQFFGSTTPGGQTKQGRNVPNIIIASMAPFEAVVRTFSGLQ